MDIYRGTDPVQFGEMQYSNNQILSLFNGFLLPGSQREGILESTNWAKFLNQNQRLIEM